MAVKKAKTIRRSRAGTVLCEACGLAPGQGPAKCVNGSTHSWISRPGQTYCSNCGAGPGASIGKCICNNYGKHEWV